MSRSRTSTGLSQIIETNHYTGCDQNLFQLHHGQFASESMLFVSVYWMITETAEAYCNYPARGITTNVRV